jgi:nucleotide-binding universal stress UspA family protein
MFRTIVVGTDGSPTAGIAVDQAGELAHALGANVYVVSAYAGAVRPEDHLDNRQMVADAPIAVANAAAERLRELGVEHVEVARSEGGDPAEAILDLAERLGADLIVVGNKGVSGIRRFLLGSVAQKVVAHAPCGVLVSRTT